jgi:transcriptional regulator with XRE-family HTH domain
VTTFSRFLKQSRVKRNLRQKQLAYLLGYEQSYISALERGVKGPPRRDFVDRLIRNLALDEAEQGQLKEAITASRRHFSLPRCVSEVELQLVHQLAPQLGRLTPLQIQLIELALAIPAGSSPHQVSTCSFGGAET